MGQRLSDASRDIATLTLEVIALVGDTGLRAPILLVSELVGLVTLTFV